MTPEQLTERLLEGQECANCGHPLTPDEPCAECGTIPAVTKPALREALAADPLAVAEAEAVQAEAEALRMLDAAIGKFHDADVIRYIPGSS